MAEAVWRPEEIRRFWALVRKAGLDHEGVSAIIRERFGKEKLHDLRRNEFLRLLNDLVKKCDPHHGVCGDDEWALIKHLQYELGWSDTHLENYILKHGRRIGTHRDAIRFMDSEKARSIITALTKIKDWQKSKEVQGENGAD